MNAPSQPCHCHPWSAWVLDHLQLGLLVLDAHDTIVFANHWLLTHANLTSDAVLGKPLLEVFPQIQDSAFERALALTVASGYPSLLSQTLHPAPLPIFLPTSQRGNDKLLRQSIRIIPASRQDSALMRQSYTLIQINDVTQPFMRERLLKAQAGRLKGLAEVDVLTELGNRRRLDEVLPQAMRSARKAAQPLSLVMFDVDYFKQFNDSYGHLAGDDCLRQVAQRLREVFRRPQDVVARYGGEEMVAVLPETHGQAARKLTQQVLHKVYALGIPHRGSAVADRVTVSAGVAVYEPGTELSPEDLLKAADQALYQAKSGGRNQVCGPM